MESNMDDPAEHITLNQMIGNAIEAEKTGVAIDWRSMAITIFNVASQHIATLEASDEQE
jgi:hypothetical protein